MANLADKVSLPARLAFAAVLVLSIAAGAYHLKTNTESSLKLKDASKVEPKIVSLVASITGEAAVCEQTIVYYGAAQKWKGRFVPKFLAKKWVLEDIKLEHSFLSAPTSMDKLLLASKRKLAEMAVDLVYTQKHSSVFEAEEYATQLHCKEFLVTFDEADEQLRVYRATGKNFYAQMAAKKVSK
jgi:hypothetical protein